jgi:hypothetical protein
MAAKKQIFQWGMFTSKFGCSVSRCRVRFSLKAHSEIAFQSVQSAECFVPAYTTEPNAANLNESFAGWQQTSDLIARPTGGFTERF